MANGDTGVEEVWEGITPSTPEGMANKASLIIISKRLEVLPCSAHQTEINKNSSLRKKLMIGFTVLSAVVVVLKWAVEFLVGS